MNPHYDNNYLTPNEIVHKYPVVENYGWNASKIGTFFSSGLLIGKRKILKSKILESSFLELISYFEKVSEKKRINGFDLNRKDYLTPDELIHKYRHLENDLDWNASKVGIFFSSGFLIGYRNSKEYKALINEGSFLELVDYVTSLSLKGK